MPRTQRITRFRPRRLGIAVVVAALPLVVLAVMTRPRDTVAAGMINDVNVVTMTSAQCLQCHVPDANFSHPSQITPQMAVPESMPLEGGQVTCITCHDNTLAGHANNRRAAKPGPLLRTTENPTIVFCAQCHTESVTVSRSSMHPGAMARAHERFTLGGHALVGEDNSRNCLSCHDGSIAMDVSGNSMTGARGPASHGTGMLYPAAGNAMLGLKSRAKLEAALRLPADRVACITCHSLYSHEKKLIVKSNANSALCMSCHEQ